jgi:hypothetical protein
MLKRLLTFSAVYGALSVYWRGIYGYGFYGTDELKVFISFAKAADLEELLLALFTPFTQHFMPVFKAFFFLEYSLFGASSTPYHAVSIGLYGISALLLWRFLYEETGDRTTAFLCSIVYSANTAYYAIITWLFLQQFTLTMLFMLLALLSASRSLKKGTSFVSASLYCLLSSFCLSFGAAAWLFTAIYVLLKQTLSAAEERPRFRSLVLRLAPIAASGAVSFISYRYFLRELSNIGFSFLAFDPVLIAKGTAVMYGDIMLDTSGFYYIIKVLSEHTGTDVSAFMPALRALIIGVFFAALILALLLFKRLGRTQKATAIAGIAFSLLSAAITIAGRASYLDYDIYEITNTVRYKYFPLFSLLVVAAPYLARTGKRIKAVFVLILPFWVFLHSLILADLYFINRPRIETINNAMAFIKKSVDQPILRTPGGEIALASSTTTGSRTIEDIVFFRGQPMHYIDLMHLFKKPGEIITGLDGRFFHLREHITIDMEKIISEQGRALSKGRTIKVSDGSKATFTLEGIKAPKPSPFQHLHLKMTADRPSRGTLLYRSENGGEESRDFKIRESIIYRRYLLPCPSGSSLKLELEPGIYKIKGLMLYY